MAHVPRNHHPTTNPCQTMIKAFHKFLLSLSLRTHLVLMVLLLSLPAVALITYSGWDRRRNAFNDGIIEAKMMVRSILTEQYNMTGDAEQLVTTLAQLADVKSHRVAASNAILADIMKLNHQFTNIVIADRFGDIWASAIPFSSTASLKGTRSFENAVRTGRFSSGEYGIGKISGKPNIGFGYPIFGAGGAMDGVIVVNVDFTYMNQLLMESGLPRDASFTVTDCEGVVIYRNLDSGPQIGTRLSEALFRQIRKGSDDIALNEEGAITSYGKLGLRSEKSPYLYVKGSIPVQQTLVKARRAQLVSIALLSPVLLVAVLLATLIAKLCFVNRINRLQDASHRLADGDLTARVGDLIGGSELGALGLCFDDMAGRLAARERELLAMNQTLAARVEEETERRMQQERLLARHARLAAMGEMIGAIAHQWRQPLATLGAIIQSLGMASERGALDRSFLERAESDAQKQLYYMSDTIEDFRNFFSPEKVVETFEVRDKINEVKLLVAPQFANSGVALELVDQAPGLPLQIRGYQNEFKQSVLNLISNAFDAVIARWGKGSSAGLVVISLDRTGADGGVLVEVRDNGCGIPPEIAEKIYEPYFTSKPDGKGTGIGLYMSKLIIEESLGGRLGFCSLPEGTSFRIELPPPLT